MQIKKSWGLYNRVTTLLKERFPILFYFLRTSGLAGRYGIAEDMSSGDLEALERLRSSMKPGGIMLLTIPVGRDAVVVPLHRVYGLTRLPRLLEGYIVEKEEYWVKNNHNEWRLTEKKDALSREPQEWLYGLGCFVLRRPRY